MDNELSENNQLPAETPSGLDHRQEKFCYEYLLDNNAGRAAIRAGYSEGNARNTGSRLLQMPAIKEYIEEHQASLREKYKVTAERVMQELALIAFSDMSDYFGATNSPLELSQIAPEKRRALAGVRINKLATKSYMNYQLNYKTHDKVKALMALGKMMGLDKHREPSFRDEIKKIKREEEEERKAAEGLKGQCM